MSAQALPEAVRRAVQEAQDRVWELRALAQCVAEATGPGCGATIKDPLAAMDGLVTMADAINLSLDPSTFAKRVAQIEAEAAEAVAPA